MALCPMSTNHLLEGLLINTTSPKGVVFVERRVSGHHRVHRLMETVMKRLWLIGASAALVASCACGPAVGQAANKDFGRREYMSNCAVCHGVDGQGKGPLYATGFLAREPTDLTRLASANRGVFPFERLYQVIDGRQAVAAHGPRDMPVWGDEYYEEGTSPDVRGVVNPEAYVRARILALIDYLARMQASR